MKRIGGFIFIWIITLSACKQSNRPMDIGYYYWQNAAIPASETKVMDSMGLQYLYPKIADIDWSFQHTEARPITKLTHFDFSNNKQAEVIPVIFITNTVMLEIDSASCQILAQKVFTFYTDWIHKFPHNIGAELQIDCDWTPQSKNLYFYFLHLLKQQLEGRTLSITLRLYPYKYPQTMGVPPVDKAVLMCYNMGTIQNYTETNSIISTATLQSYLVTKAYPLPLDLALPTYGWYVWFSNKAYKGIIYEEELAQLKPLLQQTDATSLVLNKDTATAFKYFRNGDVFRIEYPSQKTLAASYQLLQQYFPDARRLLFFHWSAANVRQYGSFVQTCKE